MPYLDGVWSVGVPLMSREGGVHDSTVGHASCHRGWEGGWKRTTRSWMERERERERERETERERGGREGGRRDMKKSYSILHMRRLLRQF